MRHARDRRADADDLGDVAGGQGAAPRRRPAPSAVPSPGRRRRCRRRATVRSPRSAARRPGWRSPRSPRPGPRRRAPAARAAVAACAAAALASSAAVGDLPRAGQHLAHRAPGSPRAPARMSLRRRAGSRRCPPRPPRAARRSRGCVSTSPSGRGDDLSRSRRTAAIWSWMARTTSLHAVGVVGGVAGQAADVGRHHGEAAAASPARAASTEPLTASMLVCTATRAMPSTIFSMRRLDGLQRADQAGHRAVSSQRVVDAAAKPADRPRGCRRAAAPWLQRASTRCRRRRARGVGGLLDLRHGGGGLLGGGGLRLGAAADLVDRGEDLAGRAGQLLHGGRQLLGGRADLLGAPATRRCRLQLFGQSPPAPGRSAGSGRATALCCCTARCACGGGRGLLLGGAGDLLGAALGFAARRARPRPRRSGSPARLSASSGHLGADRGQQLDADGPPSRLGLAHGRPPP